MNTALSMSSMTNSPVWVLAQGQVIALGLLGAVKLP